MVKTVKQITRPQLSLFFCENGGGIPTALNQPKTLGSDMLCTPEYLCHVSMRSCSCLCHSFDHSTSSLICAFSTVVTSSETCLGRHFGPEKKYFSPPPPKEFPNSPQTPPGPLAPPPRENPPPPPSWDFRWSTDPSPSRRLGLSLPPPRPEKNKKYPKRPPSCVNLWLSA